jgi:hypothetical protein
VKKYDWKGIAELVGIFAVVLSLLLVAFELRQSTAVATAQAVFDVNTVHDQSWRARAQYPELDALIEKGHAEPDTLSERERSQFFAWIRADMNVIEATWFYHDRGIIPQEDIDGWISTICSRVITSGGRQYWASEKQHFAVGFRNAIDGWCF